MGLSHSRITKLFVYSGIECKDEVFAAHQVQHADLKPVVATIASETLASVPVAILEPSEPVTNGAIVAIIPPEEERPIPVTELIFAPRKKEMNKGFLTFSQEEGLTSECYAKNTRLGTCSCFIAIVMINVIFAILITLYFSVLKDEPEDLTHLAPTAGDACIPLESSPFDMFDEFILSDNYCSLLGDDLESGSPVDSLTPDSLLLSSPEPHVNISIDLQLVFRYCRSQYPLIRFYVLGK